MYQESRKAEYWNWVFSEDFKNDAFPAPLIFKEIYVIDVQSGCYFVFVVVFVGHWMSLS